MSKYRVRTPKLSKTLKTIKLYWEIYTFMIKLSKYANLPQLLQVCLLQAEVCLLQVSIMSESGRGTSKLFKTSKIIKIGLEYKELQQNENRKCFGKLRRC